MRSTTTTLRAAWLSADESNVLTHGCLTAGAAALGCRRVKTPLLVSTDSCFHRPAWIPEVVVKSAKFHTCSQTTASMRSKPDVHAHVFDPVFLAPGLRLRPSAGRPAYVSAPTGWPMTSTRPAPAEWRAPRRPSSTVAASTAPTTSTLTAAVKTAKAQPNLDVPYRPAQVDDNQADAAVLPAWSPERAFRRPTRSSGQCEQVPGSPLGAGSARPRPGARMYTWSRSTTSERCSRVCRAAARCWCAIV